MHSVSNTTSNNSTIQVVDATVYLG